MSILSRRILLLSSAAFTAAALLGPANAEDIKITIGYQTVVEPSKVPQADGAYEKATKAAISGGLRLRIWTDFGSTPSCLSAASRL